MADKYVKLDDVIKLFCLIDCGYSSSSPRITNEECADIKRFRSLPTIDVEPEKDRYCEFCANHESGDTLYEMNDWDGGIGFDYIRNIHYCPICGKKLKVEKLEF